MAQTHQNSVLPFEVDEVVLYTGEPRIDHGSSSEYEPGSSRIVRAFCAISSSSSDQRGSYLVIIWPSIFRLEAAAFGIAVWSEIAPRAWFGIDHGKATISLTRPPVAAEL